jgi:hypothetical protein
MKRIILTIAIISVGATALFAQSPGFKKGARFSLGEASFKDFNHDNITTDSKLLMSGGVSVSNQFTENFGLMADVLFTSKGAKGSGTTNVGAFGSEEKFDDTYRLFYAELPIMAKISVGADNFYIKGFAGPSINFNLLGTETRVFENGNVDNNEGYRDRQLNDLEVIEFSTVIGGGIDVVNSVGQAFFVDLRLSSPISSLGKIQGATPSNSYFSIGVGYLY